MVFMPSFTKKYWHLFGEEISHEVLVAINSRIISEEWNDTTVVLLPKTGSPELISQHCPIRMCNVIYKIISKMLDVISKTSFQRSSPHIRVSLFLANLSFIMYLWLMSALIK